MGRRETSPPVSERPVEPPEPLGGDQLRDYLPVLLLGLVRGTPYLSRDEMAAELRSRSTNRFDVSDEDVEEVLAGLHASGYVSSEGPPRSASSPGLYQLTPSGHSELARLEGGLVQLHGGLGAVLGWQVGGDLAPVRTAVVGDHWVWVDALAYAIARDPRVLFVGQASTLDDAASLVLTTNADVALVADSVGSQPGIDLVGRLRGTASDTRVIVVSGDSQPRSLDRARRGGASALIDLDRLSREQLISTIVRVAEGERVFPTVPPGPEAPAEKYRLTQGDLALIAAVARGSSNNEIARELSMAPQTVRNRLTVIGTKLGVSGRLGILRAAIAEDLVSLDAPRRSP